MSGDSSETEEVSYDELYASVLDLYRPIALNGDTSAVLSNLSTEEVYFQLIRFLKPIEWGKKSNIAM